jgi:hypothetical protein
MADTNSVFLFQWGFRGWLLAMLALPGIGMITAGFLVSPDALTDDGMPPGSFLLAMGVSGFSRTLPPSWCSSS